MNRLQISLLLIAAVAVPAAAAAYSQLAPRPDDNRCFASGSATYRIAAGTSAPDFRVGFAERDGDLRIQLVDRPEIADFVLVDDFSGREPAPCRSSTPIQTVALDSSSPDVTVNLFAEPDAAGVDYRIYVHSVRYSQQDAAALLAAIWKRDQQRQAQLTIPSKTADRIKPSATMLAVSPAD